MTTDEIEQAFTALENIDITAVRDAIVAWMLYVGVELVVAHVPVCQSQDRLLNTLAYKDSVVIVGSRTCIPLSHLKVHVAINILMNRLVRKSNPDKVTNMYWHKCSDEVRVDGRDPSITKQWLSAHISEVAAAIDSVLHDQYAYEALLGVLMMMAEKQEC